MPENTAGCQLRFERKPALKSVVKNFLSDKIGMAVTAPVTHMDRFIDIAVEQFARDHTEPETDLYVRLREETIE